MPLWVILLISGLAIYLLAAWLVSWQISTPDPED